MHFDFKGILEGAFNSVFINKEIEKVSEYRLEICNNCPNFSENRKKNDPNFSTIRPDEFCTLCGCNTKMKSRSLAQICPDNPPRWEAIMNQQDEWKIDVRLEEEERKS
jgi:hypothetical protein